MNVYRVEVALGDQGRASVLGNRRYPLIHSNPIAAVCTRRVPGKFLQHAAGTVDTCTCGIYAVTDVRDLAPMLRILERQMDPDLEPSEHEWHVRPMVVEGWLTGARPAREDANPVTHPRSTVKGTELCVRRAWLAPSVSHPEARVKTRLPFTYSVPDRPLSVWALDR